MDTNSLERGRGSELDKLKTLSLGEACRLLEKGSLRPGPRERRRAAAADDLPGEKEEVSRPHGRERGGEDGQRPRS